MRRIISIITLLGLVLPNFTGAADASTPTMCGVPTYYSIITDRGYGLAGITVANSAENLEVTFTAQPGRFLTHAALAPRPEVVPPQTESLDQISMSGFPYRADFPAWQHVTSYGFSIPLSDIPARDGMTISLVAYARVTGATTEDSYPATTTNHKFNFSVITHTLEVCPKLILSGVDLTETLIPNNYTNAKVGAFNIDVPAGMVNVRQIQLSFVPESGDYPIPDYTNIRNVHIRDAQGRVIDGPRSLRADGTVMLTDFAQFKGWGVYTVHADLGSKLTDHVIQVSINPALLIADAPVLPNDVVRSSLVRIKRSTLNVSVADETPATHIAAGTPNVPTTHLMFDTIGSGGIARVTQVKLHVTTESPMFPGMIRTCRLYDGERPITINSRSTLYYPNQTAPGGYAIHTLTVPTSSDGLNIPRESRKTIRVTCDVGTGATSGSFAVGIDADAVYAIDHRATKIDTITNPDPGPSITVTE